MDLYHTVIILSLAAVGMATAPSVCVSSPVPTAEAGSLVTAFINGNFGGQCEATLKFKDENFLPVTFGFETLTCLGDLKTAELRIPWTVPDGEAYLLWQCTNQDSPNCSHLWLSGGSNDPTSIALDQNGTVACLVPAATVTTLSTVTGTSTTFVSEAVSTEFEAIAPTATSTRVLTLTGASTTITQTLRSTYFSTLPSAANHTTASASTGSWTSAPLSKTGLFLSTGGSHDTTRSIGASSPISTVQTMLPSSITPHSSSAAPMASWVSSKTSNSITPVTKKTSAATPSLATSIVSSVAAQSSAVPPSPSTVGSATENSIIPVTAESSSATPSPATSTVSSAAENSIIPVTTESSPATPSPATSIVSSAAENSIIPVTAKSSAAVCA